MREKEQILQVHQKIPDALKKRFEGLYKDHLQVLCIAAYKIVLDKEKAKDCVQDLFLELWDKNKVSRLLEMEDAGAYLFTCVRHKCYRMLAVESAKDKGLNGFAGVQDSILPGYENTEDASNPPLLLSAIQNMPSQPYKAFQLHVIEGKKRKEVADLMGVSLNTVKTHLKIAFRIARNNIVKNSKNIHPHS